MSTQVKTLGSEGNNPRFFKGFTKMMLVTMIVIELAIFASGTYMSHHKLTGIGTDEHHPFVELPGDAETQRVLGGQLLCRSDCRLSLAPAVWYPTVTRYEKRRLRHEPVALYH
jgi:hypothetical protein